MEPGIARVCVSDTGVGIPEDFRERVFEKFFQVDGTDTRKHGGSGLGLSIAREIVELHGGRLWLDSTTEGEGSRFCFNLPLYDPEKAEQMKIQPVYTDAGGIRPDAEKTVIPMYVAPSGSPRASQSVLIVDDDRDFLDMMREILDEDGFKTHTAPDGVSALNQLFSGQRIDVILLDITMPKISGYELCRAIKSFDATRGIPVLMLTAAGQSGQISQGYEAGAAGYLVKPFEIEVFRRTLGKLLGEEPK
jgi:two-component system sensor histidine kinase ChiS